MLLVGQWQDDALMGIAAMSVVEGLHPVEPIRPERLADRAVDLDGFPHRS